MNSTNRTIALVAMLLGLPGLALSEDIELFVRQNPDADAPNVLFVIDNAANFSENLDDPTMGTCQIGGSVNTLAGKVGGIEQCALHAVISALDPESVQIGVMVYNDGNVVDWEGRQCDGIADVNNAKPGGCLVYPMQLLTATAKPLLLDWIQSWTVEGGSVPGQIKGSAKRTGATMQEAWAYYEGRTGISGRSYEGALESTCDRYVIYIGNSFGPAGTPGDQQRTDAGPRNSLIGVSNTLRMNALPAATPAQQTLIQREVETTCGRGDLARSPHEGNGFYADEWSRYMKQTHQITTYSIGVLGPKCQASYAATLSSMAGVGGGRYFPTRNLDELVAAIQTSLSEMLAKDSVFASVSLPISVSTQGTYLNQVYIGMFRPDGSGYPRWAGNLKQYRLGLVDRSLRLVDAQEPGQPAISSARTGFLSSCALSYWTPTAHDTYWQNYKFVQPPFCGSNPPVSNTPDGDLVEKGGQGYTLRGRPDATSITRNIKTCDASCSSTLAPFDVENEAITKAALDPTLANPESEMTDDQRADLINWALGKNNKGDEVDPESYQIAGPDAMRPSVHGDVLHSRPVAINYASPDDDPPMVVVFYGGNDGVLRAVNGNRSADIGDIGEGREMWSFVPPEFYAGIKQLRDNKPQIFFHGEAEDRRETRKEKPYGFDGPITSYTDAGDTWIFAGMRRGGRMLYAFDVSDITTDPDSPTLKWRIGCPNPGNDTGCTAFESEDMTEIVDLGQTWSSPTLLKSLGHFEVVTEGTGSVNKPKPMLIMGGGYDDCEDLDPNECSPSTKGDGIYVLDADTGDVLVRLDTDRAVTGDVFVVNNRETGLAQWAYAADLGGNVYRISGINANTPFANTAPGSWTVTKIAALGCSSGGTCAANRKFMFAPDVVVEPAPNSGTHVILIGSGDREKPVQNDQYDEAYETTNYFFMVKDVPADSEWLEKNMRGCSSAICLDALFAINGSDNPTAADLADRKGWYLSLEPHEQVVTSAITVFGSVTFSTHIPYVPERGVCVPETGTAKVYNVRFANAAPSKPGALNRYEEIDGGGLPPSPVAGQVKIGKVIVPFIIGGDPRSPLEGSLPVPPSLKTLPKSITYWYIEKR